MNYYFVTGTSSGLGAAMAEALLERGNLVHGFSRRGNEKLVSLGIERGVPFADHQLDLSDPHAIHYIFQLWRRLPLSQATSINLIFNAASVEPINLIGGHQDLDAILNAQRLNFLIPIQLIELFVAQAQELVLPKRIMLISSGAARKPYPGWGSYCASKAGAEMFAQVLGREQEAQPNPIKIASIAPGVIDTEMQAVIRNQEAERFPLIQRFLDLKTEGHLWSASFVATHLLRYLHEDHFGTPVCTDIRDWVKSD